MGYGVKEGAEAVMVPGDYSFTSIVNGYLGGTDERKQQNK